ncbi:hypothetical protein CH380_19180 [Leptospira adleri]|uniref:Uncharacterized protein n=1 Tax=Leptospira adleri TaxID=2023186 RepID=A0A2M9YJ58_9LEPT|nr:hypothetical protein CH380_19180 [Leptospira adleri]PJZ61918.1 hypothetical protein CH376_10985 [Leptospira adleri]
MFFADSLLSKWLNRYKGTFDIQLEIDSLKSKSYKAFLEVWEFEEYPLSRAKQLGEIRRLDKIAELEKLKEFG